MPPKRPIHTTIKKKAYNTPEGIVLRLWVCVRKTTYDKNLHHKGYHHYVAIFHSTHILQPIAVVFPPSSVNLRVKMRAHRCYNRGTGKKKMRLFTQEALNLRQLLTKGIDICLYCST